MKYILKKDLPFANRGAEILFGLNDWCYVVHKKAKEEGGIEDGNTWIGRKQDLIDSGWIEEVKPREFILHLDKNNIGVMVEHYDLGKHYEKYSKDSEVIRVCEVIEWTNKN